MKNFIQIIIFALYLIFCPAKLVGQNSASENLERKIDSLQNEPKKAFPLIQYYIKKSKKENNDEALVYAYRYASKYYQSPKNKQYADSSLIIAKKSQSVMLLAESYLSKGTVLMDEEHYQEALDNILVANRYAIELQDDYFTFKTIYFIAQNKIYLGNYEDANVELKSCIDYFKKNIQDRSLLGKNAEMYYLYSLMSYLDTNTKLGKSAENRILIPEALAYVKKNKLNNYIPYFISIQGTDAYFEKDYAAAIAKLTAALKLYDDQWSHNTEVFYLGLSNWKLGRHAVAIKYFEEMDKEYEREKKLDPQFRAAYEYLIKYNDSLGKRDLQLTYINKLMKLDRSYENNFKYLYKRINKEYDTQKLIAEKKKIENALSLRGYIGVFMLLLIGVMAFYGYRFYNLQKSYKQRFNEMTTEKIELEETDSKDLVEEFLFNKTDQNIDPSFYSKIPGLKASYVKDILLQLENFERENKFAEPQLSLKMLSEHFGTNYVYLSKIINEYRGKNFNNYINDLRLEYAVDLLKDSKYLDYDIKELAAISGFATSTNFSSNFVRKYQIKPSYFIKQLKEKL